MNKLPISILIPTMNRPDSLKRTLTCVFNGNCVPDEVVIVDQSNNLEDSNANKHVLSNFKDNARIVYLFQNVPSLTKARNLAIHNCSNNIVIFMDDDVDIMNDTLLETYELMKQADVALVGGLDNRMKKSKGFAGYLLGFKSFKNRHIGHVTKSVFGRFPLFKKGIEKTETMWAMGFYFSIKRDLVFKWNLSWDENLKGYAYAEDLDFSYLYYKRAKSNNFKCYMTKRISVDHLCSQEYRTPNRKATFMYVLHRFYLWKKHNMGLVSKFWVNLTNFSLLLTRIIKRQKPEDFKDALRYYRKNKNKVYSGDFYYGD